MSLPPRPVLFLLVCVIFLWGKGRFWGGGGRLHVCASVAKRTGWCVCLSVCLFVCLAGWLAGCLAVCLSVCLSVRPSVCPSVRPSVCLSVCLSVSQSVCLCPSLCLSASLSLCVSPSFALMGARVIAPGYSQLPAGRHVGTASAAGATREPAMAGRPELLPTFATAAHRHAHAWLRACGLRTALGLRTGQLIKSSRVKSSLKSQSGQCWI